MHGFHDQNPSIGLILLLSKITIEMKLLPTLGLNSVIERFEHRKYAVSPIATIAIMPITKSMIAIVDFFIMATSRLIRKVLSPVLT